MTGFLIGIIWVLLGGIMWHKQKQCDEYTGIEVLAFIFAPFWLLGAFIRQVFIEKWK